MIANEYARGLPDNLMSFSIYHIHLSHEFLCTSQSYLLFFTYNTFLLT